MTGVRGVIFDKDGTLFDFGTTWEAWAASFLLRICARDRDAAAALGREIGFDLAAQRFAPDSIAIAGTAEEVALVLAPHLPRMTEGDVLQMLVDEATNAPQAEAVPLIPYLTELKARGLALGVATNDAEVPARAHLAASGVLEIFDFIAGFDSGHGGKPAPGQLHAFCNTLALDPGEVVMVGDSLHDLRAGRSAGMRVVGVLTGMATRGDLAPHADVVLDDIGHLPVWLDQIAP